MVDYFSSTTLLSRKKTTIMLSLFLLCLYGCGNINNEKPYTFNPEEESRISDSILAIRKTLDSNKVERYKKNILLDKARFKLKKNSPIEIRKRIVEDSMFNLNYPNAVLLKNYLKTKRLKDFIEEENWNKIIKGIRKNDRVYLMIKERDVAARIFGGANLLIYNTKLPNAFFEKEELLLFATINNFVKWEINSK